MANVFRTRRVGGSCRWRDLASLPRGVVYIVIGSLAALAAFHRGGRTTGSRGVLVEILSQPYGQVMLGVIAVGFMGYTLWRLA
jgi:hypothetical protein